MANALWWQARSLWPREWGDSHVNGAPPYANGAPPYANAAPSYANAPPPYADTSTAHTNTCLFTYPYVS